MYVVDPLGHSPQRPSASWAEAGVRPTSAVVGSQGGAQVQRGAPEISAVGPGGAGNRWNLLPRSPGGSEGMGPTGVHQMGLERERRRALEWIEEGPAKQTGTPVKASYTGINPVIAVDSRKIRFECRWSKPGGACDRWDNLW